MSLDKMHPQRVVIVPFVGMLALNYSALVLMPDLIEPLV